MSRTEGFSLPRIPTSHARATSPTSIQPHLAQSLRKERRGRTLTEPTYTSYLGTPRQDVPYHVYKDIAMYEDVFEKRGSFIKKPTHNIACPLSQEYSSLHDTHCRHLYLNNHKLREHLINLGLITEDLKIVASTQQQRQKIRAHELLERKELLMNKLNQRQSQRLSNLEVPVQLPKILSWSVSREEERRKRLVQGKETKRKKLQMGWEREQQEQAEKKHQENLKLKKLVAQQQLMSEKKRWHDINKQQALTSKQFVNEIVHWHRDSEVIKARMIKLRKGMWSQRKKTPTDTEVAQTSLESSTASISKSNQEIMYQLDSSLARVKFSNDEVTKEVSKVESSELGSEKAIEEQTITKDKTTEESKVVDAVEEQTGSPLTTEIPPVFNKNFKEQEQVIDVGMDVTADSQVQQVASTIDSGVQKVAEAIDVEAQDVTKAMDSGTQEDTIMQEQPVEVLDAEKSLQLFAAILLEHLSQFDQTGSGYLATQDFLQVLSSRQLGLRLKNDELYGFISQLDPNNSGWTVYNDVLYDLAATLLQLVVQNTLEGGESQPVELYWSQLSSPSYGYLYLNRTTGQIQRGRPEEYRPFMKDDIFEDSIVDFFETSDINQDGLVDGEEFYQLLVSHDVGGRLFPQQVEQLNQLFQQSLSLLPDKKIGLDLQKFATVARMLITFVYQNTFPSAEEWIELDSPKVGRFWLNKITGETHLPAQHLSAPPDEPIQDSLLAKSLPTGTLSSTLPTIAEGPNEDDIDHTPQTDQNKVLTTDPPSDSAADTDKKQRRHKRKSKKKHPHTVATPPPLRPRSRPSSQQSATRSEEASGGEVMNKPPEGLDERNEEQSNKDPPEETKENARASDSRSSSSQVVKQGVHLEEIPTVNMNKTVDVDGNTSTVDIKETGVTAE